MNKDNKAKAVHQIWSEWMKYFFDKCFPGGPNGNLQMSNKDVERWKKLSNTEFNDLSKEQKESSYYLADKYLKDDTRRDK